MEKIYDVIIIGAGASGIGASLNLSKKGIEHIILEARDRIGGRVAAQEIEGTSIQIGASFVHSPHRKHIIVKYMEQLNWKSTPAFISSQSHLYQGNGQINNDIPNKAIAYCEKLDQNIALTFDKSKDISIAEASQSFLASFEGEEELKVMIDWKQRVFGMINGADLTDISTRDYVQREFDVSQTDSLPQGGYSSLIEAIYNIHKSQVKFNEIVTKIDYSEEIIKIHTKSNIYRAKKVISSLPLGILQKDLVQFQPKLSQSHQKAIKNIGNGVCNKLFVAFEESFWDQSKEWVNFITKKWQRYIHAQVIRKSKVPMFCVFISKKASLEFDALSDQEVIQDFIKFLSKFNIKREIKVKAYHLTRWHQDPFAFGSYSFSKVGTTPQDFRTLKTPINDRLWFVGQHCHPSLNSVVHGALETGLDAAEEVQKSLKK